MTIQEINTLLINGYKEMAEMTLPECRACRVPFSCCSRDYCEIAAEWAKDNYNTTLVPLNTHPTLPFMGATGCIVPPHMRALCTLHTCDINALGMKKNDDEWTTKYYALREVLMVLEVDKAVLLSKLRNNSTGTV